MKKNLLFPGLPDYVGPANGYFAFVHHEVLCEYSTNIRERVAFIESCKPKHERETRLRHLLYLDPIKCPAAAEIKLLNDDYVAKIKPLKDDYEAKRKLLNDDYWAKIKFLDDDHVAKRNLLNDDHVAKIKLLDDDHVAKRNLLDKPILVYIKNHILDCRWIGDTLVFPCTDYP